MTVPPVPSSAQPNSLIALNGLLEMRVKPAGSFALPVGGGGGGGGGVETVELSVDARTTSDALPLMLLWVAVIETVPALTPLTNPEVSTVAMLASLDVHITGR